MFAPWIKRKSLKRASKGRRLIIDGSRLNLIMLLGVAGLVVAVGAMVVRQSLAQSDITHVIQSPAATPSPTPNPMPLPSASG